MGSVESVESVGSVESVESACPVGQDWPYPRIRGKDSQEKVSKKKVPTGFPRYPKLHGSGSRRVRKSRFFKIPKVTYIVQVPTNFPSKGSQIKVPTRFPRFAELHRAGSHKSSKSRFPTKYRFFSK